MNFRILVVAFVLGVVSRSEIHAQTVTFNPMKNSAKPSPGAPQSDSTQPKEDHPTENSFDKEAEKRNRILTALEVKYNIKTADSPTDTQSPDDQQVSQDPGGLLDKLVDNDLLDDLLEVVDVNNTQPVLIVKTALKLLSFLTKGKESATENQPVDVGSEYAGEFLEKLKRHVDAQKKSREIESQKEKEVAAAEDKARKEKLRLELEALNNRIRDLQKQASSIEGKLK